jgi:hypothetical protein
MSILQLNSDVREKWALSATFANGNSFSVSHKGYIEFKPNEGRSVMGSPVDLLALCEAAEDLRAFLSDEKVSPVACQMSERQKKRTAMADFVVKRTAELMQVAKLDQKLAERAAKAEAKELF